MLLTLEMPNSTGDDRFVKMGGNRKLFYNGTGTVEGVGFHPEMQPGRVPFGSGKEKPGELGPFVQSHKQKTGGERVQGSHMPGFGNTFQFFYVPNHLSRRDALGFVNGKEAVDHQISSGGSSSEIDLRMESIRAP